MGKIKMRFIFFCTSLLIGNTLFAYPIQVTRFDDEGSLYVESSSIVRMGSFIRMTYVINYWQPQSYGSHTYLS